MSQHRNAVFTQFDLQRLMGEGADPSMKRQLDVPVTIDDIENAITRCASEIANIVSNNIGDLQSLPDDIHRDEDGELQAPYPCDDSNVNDLGIFASAYTELHYRLSIMQDAVKREHKAAQDRISGKQSAKFKVVGYVRNGQGGTTTLVEEMKA